MRGKEVVKNLLLLTIAAIPLIYFLYHYHDLPDSMAIRFDTEGNPNNYQNKGTFLLYMSFFGGIPILLSVFAWIDPKSDNIGKFIVFFDTIRFFVTSLMSIAFLLVLMVNLGKSLIFPMSTMILIGIGLLYLVIGNYLGRTRYNYAVGVRTRWTLASEKVWRKTHRASGSIWMVAGILIIISSFLKGPIVVNLVLFSAFLSMFGPAVYSYLFFRKEKNRDTWNVNK